MCDVCSQIPCIQMCCPHGEAFISPDQQNPMQKECKRPGIQQRYSPIFHDESESEITSRIGKEDYRLIAPKEGQFECPESDFGKSFQPLLYFADHTGFKTYTDGSLRGIVIDGYDENATEHVVQYKSQQFCVVQTDLDLESEDFGISDKLEFQLYVCKNPAGMAPMTIDGHINCEATMIPVQSSTLMISIVFLLITLIIYLIEPSLKKRNLFSKITISLIVNMTATFITIVYGHLSKDIENLTIGLHKGTRGKKILF